MKSCKIVLALGCLCAAWPALGTSLYTQDFEVDSTATWTVNHGPSDDAANFFFDYSSVGIPAAPNGAGTRGMKLQANLANGIFSGMSASPTAQSFTGDYTLTFDWWANFNGPFPGGGSGSTNLSTFGVGTAGTTPQWPGGVQDSVWFAGTGDGGSGVDWRAYSAGAGTGYTVASGVFPFASQNNSDPYFAGFGNNAAPAAQFALYPQQTGSTAVGSGGMEWHQVEIAKVGTTITWRVDSLLMATINDPNAILAGGKIFFGHSDINAGSSTDVNDVSLLFTLIDNINVTPEPASAMLVAIAALFFRRR